MMVRYARELRMDDLRSDNAILIGSDESNPWIELFRPQLHFGFRFEADPDKPSGFANFYPRPGEATIYSTKGREDQTYGVIAYVPNLANNGHVLIVAGLNTAGTQAAATFLLDPSAMMATLERARTAHGDLQPFELLLGAGNVATNASTPHIVLERIGPAPATVKQRDYRVISSACLGQAPSVNQRRSRSHWRLVPTCASLNPFALARVTRFSASFALR